MVELKADSIINFSHIPELIARVQGRVKHIHQHAEQDPKFIPALETIEIMMNIINHYATWVRDLRDELNKCAAKNQAQAEMIQSLGGIKAGIQ